MGDDYAIVIGIDSYANMPNGSAFLPLTSAVKDAALFEQWLRSPDGGGIKEEPPLRRIFPIKSPTVVNGQLPLPMDAEPIKDQIDDALLTLGLDAGKRIGDRLYFYFSGHGLGLGSNDVALMMANALRTMESRNISLKHYREYLQERYLFDEVIFIADCCRSRETKPIDPGKPVFTTLQDPEPPEVRDVAILAAEYGEPSFAVSGGHGLLTRALLEGLNGDPEATDQKGRVTSNTLNNFIPKRVATLAKESMVRQSPEVDLFPKKAEIIFSKPKRKVAINIIAAAGVKGDIIVCDGEDKELFRRDAQQATAGSPWQVELFDSFVPYRVRVTTFANPFMLELKKVKENNNAFQIP